MHYMLYSVIVKNLSVSTLLPIFFPITELVLQTYKLSRSKNTGFTSLKNSSLENHREHKSILFHIQIMASIMNSNNVLTNRISIIPNTYMSHVIIAPSLQNRFSS